MATETITVRCIVCPDSSPGYLPWFAHRDGGVCYGCDGEGALEVEAYEGVPYVHVERVETFLDFRLSTGEVFRAYSGSNPAEIKIMRPNADDRDEHSGVGTLWFYPGEPVVASDGMRYRAVSDLCTADKRAIFAAARLVSAAAHRVAS